MRLLAFTFLAIAVAAGIQLGLYKFLQPELEAMH